MGKRKRHAAKVAQRHGFDSSGMLGHDSTYSVNVSEQVALSVDVFYACVTLIQRLVGDADVGEYRGNERLPESRLIRRPMQSLTRRAWLKLVAGIMAVYGGTYLRRSPVRDSEGVTAYLEPLAPTRVLWHTPTQALVDGSPVDWQELAWVPRTIFPTVNADLAYLIRLARESIAAAWAADAYRADFWEKGGAPVIYLSSDQEISGPEAEAIQDRWVERRTASPGRPPVLGKGSKVETLGADLGTNASTGATAATGASIARYFGMPAWLVNVPTEAGSLTYANASAAGLDLVRYTLRPDYAGPIGDALSDEIPGDPIVGRRVVLDLNHLTTGTVLEQAQAYAIALGNKPWMIPSEVRADLHLPVDMALDEAGTPAPAMEMLT